MNTTETLYHADIRLPEGFVPPRGVRGLSYGSHARREAMVDRYGSFILPGSMDVSQFRIIEVGMIAGKVSKILYRGTLDNERDLCIVVIPNAGRPWFVKTCWVNLKTDQHKTLDRTRYAR